MPLNYPHKKSLAVNAPVLKTDSLCFLGVSMRREGKQKHLEEGISLRLFLRRKNWRNVRKAGLTQR